MYDITLSEAESLKFPEVVICPRQEGSLAYLKTTQLREENNYTHEEIYEANILYAIFNITNALGRYGFNFQESVIRSRIL